MVRVASVARSSAVPSSTVTLIVPPWVSLTLQMLRNVAKFHRIRLIPYPASALPAGLLFFFFSRMEANQPAGSFNMGTYM